MTSEWIEVVHARDMSTTMEEDRDIWDDLIECIVDKNLIHYLQNKQDYYREVQIVRNRKGKVVRRKRSVYMGCGICCDNDCDVDDDGLCKDCILRYINFQRILGDTFKTICQIKK
jgi:hypothetical protein